MPELNGQKLSRRDVEARVGRIEQIAGVRRLVLDDGPERGVEQIHVRTGAGLSYFVSPQRGLDISLAEFCGSAISWQSMCGDVHPAFFEHRGIEWLRTAAGGLLMTCGLRQAGTPCSDEGEELGIHGRAHHTPASCVSAAGRWEGDEYVMEVSGRVAEARMFGENLVLHRTIRSVLGRNAIRIEDAIENIGFEPSPLMLLYHFNFGWPLLDARTRVRFPSRRVEPRESATPREGYDRWETPQPGYAERVYDHSEMETDGEGFAEAVIENPEFPAGGTRRALEVALRWDTATLPRLVEWKMPGEGMHVLGIEPANCFVAGRAESRAQGELQFVQPGQRVETRLELEVRTS